MNFTHEKNRIFLDDESRKLIAEVTFPNISDKTVNIDHTFVDTTLRGQGVASKLIEAVAITLRKEQKKARATCSFAIKWFQQHPEFQDIYEA